MREALDALSSIETELVKPAQSSQMMDVLERVMTADRRYWEHHYTGNEQALRLQRHYSYSDRVRYYWNNPKVKDAVETLLSNLRMKAIPETMLSALLPEQYLAVRTGTLRPDGQSIILHRIRAVLRAYANACGAQAA
jgi:D-tagatose-1,6-bisphosphate aldolase subunit GatZ/KbaZ